MLELTSFCGSRITETRFIESADHTRVAYDVASAMSKAIPSSISFENKSAVASLHSLEVTFQEFYRHWS